MWLFKLLGGGSRAEDISKQALLFRRRQQRRVHGGWICQVEAIWQASAINNRDLIIFPLELQTGVELLCALFCLRSQGNDLALLMLWWGGQFGVGIDLG